MGFQWDLILGLDGDFMDLSMDISWILSTKSGVIHSGYRTKWAWVPIAMLNQQRIPLLIG